ncbi:MAG: RIP metalloprotease [Anaerolineae bacterium]
MITVIAFILILSLLIFVHELGHFIVAKRAGIVVEEFGFGYPPRAWKFWQDEGNVTLDGRQYIIGRNTTVPRNIHAGSEVVVKTAPRADGNLEVTHIKSVSQDKGEGKNGKNQTSDPQPAQAAPGQSETAVTIEALERPTEYTVNWIPFGGFVKMLGEEDPQAPGSFASKSKRIRLAVLVAGAGMNLVLAAIVFSLTFMVGVPEPVTGINAAGEELPLVSVIIDEVAPGSPAEAAGLQSGDIVLAVDDVTLRFPGDLPDYIDRARGSEVTLKIARGEAVLTVSLVPRVNPPEGQGAMGVILSHQVENEIVYYPFGESLARGLAETAQIVGFTFYVPIAIIQNIIPAEAARPTGPVGIYQLTGQAVTASVNLRWWYPVLWITAMLSTALAVTNLLPLPALDGGRIFFIFIEALRGKRIDPEKEGAIHFIGLAVLVTLMLVISYYDVVDPIRIPDFADLF